MTPSVETALTRPRVEGDREVEILDAALEVLGEVGYDRLTMDAVAPGPRPPRPPSTAAGTARSPWSSTHCTTTTSTRSPPSRWTPAPCAGDLDRVLLRHRRAHRQARSGRVRRDPDRDHPRPRVRSGVPPRGRGAQARPPPRRCSSGRSGRGEIGPNVDIDLLAPALAGIVLHRLILLGEAPDRGPRHPRHRPDHPAGRDRGRLTCTAPTRPQQAERLTMTDTTTPEAISSKEKSETGVGQAPRLGAGPHLGRPAHGRARRHDRQHRAALHPVRPGHLDRRTCAGS